jgi:CBS domain-containing protein/nucleotide-binding universal stress UspA family protein
MNQHILVVLDGSPASEHAFEVALDLAVKNGARLGALSVIEHLPVYAASLGEVQDAQMQAEEFFDGIHQRATQKAQMAGIALESGIMAGHAASSIIRHAQQGAFDLIVLAPTAHGSQWGGLSNNVVGKVVEGAHGSVMIVRDKGRAIFVSEVMSREVATVRADTPIAAVADLLIQRGVKAVPVLNPGGSVVGLITGGDLLERGGMQLRLSLQQALGPEVVREQVEAMAAGGKLASDVMSKPVETISEKVTVAQVARVMAEKHFKRLPVTDMMGHLAGIVSRADVLKAMANVTVSPAAPTTPSEGLRVVRDAMLVAVPSVTSNVSADDVLLRLLNTRLRRVVVVDAEQRPLGIITDGDLLARVAPAARKGILHTFTGMLPFAGDELQAALDLIQHHTAAEVMTKPVITLAEDASIMDAVRLMFERRIKRLPVVDTHGKLCGMVDRLSILQAMVQ